jgi:pSer/pThr/pTyr-binding forkhead associated (FHA) protein
VSRRHTEIGQEHGVWYVADLESRNGTWLDGVRVGRAVLPPRSVVRLSEGGTPITIELRAGLSSETRLAGS